MTTSSAKQTKRHREHTSNAGCEYSIETEAKLHVELGNVDRLVRLVELG